jgi:hypothetical protein
MNGQLYGGQLHGRSADSSPRIRWLVPSYTLARTRRVVRGEALVIIGGPPFSPPTHSNASSKS